MRIYSNTLPVATSRVVEMINQINELKDFYLSGGTALSLQLGHRESEDLDFFCESDFSQQTILQSLMNVGSLEGTYVDKVTLNTFLEKVKLQFLRYPYPLLEKTIEWNNLRLSSVIDIACTKLITISARGSKKDFIDLYEILKTYSLDELFKKIDLKYASVDYNHAHILKSLVYFDDADIQPMPRMHVVVKWDEVKQTIEEKVKKFIF